MKTQRIKNLVVLADTHCGDTFSIVPLNKKPEMDHGKYYEPTELQEWLWSCWQYLNKEWIPKVTNGEPFSVLFDGDCVEGLHHEARHMATNSPTYQQRWFYNLMSPLVERSRKTGGKYYHIRGTDAHDGIESEYAEAVAKELGAEKIGTTYSQIEWKINLSGVLVKAQHHISPSGSFNGRHRALATEFSEAVLDSAIWDRDRPDVLVSAHRHTHDELRFNTARGPATIFTCNAFQAKSPFAARVVGARQSTATIGASIIKVHEEIGHYTQHLTWALPEQPYMEG